MIYGKRMESRKYLINIVEEDEDEDEDEEEDEDRFIRWEGQKKKKKFET